MSQDPLAAILSQAEADRRRDRAASASAMTVSIPASVGNQTVDNSNSGGTPVLLDPSGHIDASLLYPPTAGSVARTYDHAQTVASTVWNIAHMLGGYPPPVITDESGSGLNGEVHWPDDNHVMVVFGHPQTGIVHLSL